MRLRYGHRIEDDRFKNLVRPPRQKSRNAGPDTVFHVSLAWYSSIGDTSQAKLSSAVRTGHYAARALGSEDVERRTFYSERQRMIRRTSRAVYS